jgi:hypothetical protein
VPPAGPVKPPAKYDFQHNITGDWFGLRNRLSDEGIDITGGYAMEFLGNPVGGRQQAQTYVYNILVQGDADLAAPAFFPVVLIYTVAVYWILRGKVRDPDYS